MRNEGVIPISKIVPVTAFTNKDMKRHRGLLILYGYNRFGVKNGSYRIFTKINELKTSIEIISFDETWLKRIFSFIYDLEDKFNAAKIIYKYYNLLYIFDDLINKKHQFILFLKNNK